MQAILHNGSRLMIVLPEFTGASLFRLTCIFIRLDGKGLNRIIDVLSTNPCVDRLLGLLHAACEDGSAKSQVVRDRAGLHLAHRQSLGLRFFPPRGLARLAVVRQIAHHALLL